jgi:UDP-N-acetylglucosamine 2-epimerase
VNIGDRQARRIRASSVIDCETDRRSIEQAIKQSLTRDCQRTVNPYGDGYAAQRIVDVLSAVSKPAELIRKSFMDIAQ